MVQEVPSMRIDYSYLDRRSVHAQLRGYGDQNHLRYERFLVGFLKTNPDATEAETMEAFSHYPSTQNEKIIERAWELSRAVAPWVEKLIFG